MQVLDLSYNFLLSPALIPLSTLPKLRKLNIDYNNVDIIPEAAVDNTSFPSLERLNAAENRLSAQSLLSLSKVREPHAVMSFRARLQMLVKSLVLLRLPV